MPCSPRSASESAGHRLAAVCSLASPVAGLFLALAGGAWWLAVPPAGHAGHGRVGLRRRRRTGRGLPRGRRGAVRRCPRYWPTVAVRGRRARAGTARGEGDPLRGRPLRPGLHGGVRVRHADGRQRGAAGRAVRRARCSRACCGAGTAAALALLALPLLLLAVDAAPVRDVRDASGDPSVQALLLPPPQQLPGRRASARVGSRSRRRATTGRPATSARRFSLARGWERQLDIKYNGLFYKPRLGPIDYRTWLSANSVQYVAVPQARLDYAALPEARLVRSGLPYLVPVWGNADWRVYRYKYTVPLVSGPAQLVSLRSNGITSAPRRAAWSTCASATPATGSWSPARLRGAGAGGLTRLVLERPGTVRMIAGFAPGRLVSRAPRCRNTTPGLTPSCRSDRSLGWEFPCDRPPSLISKTVCCPTASSTSCVRSLLFAAAYYALPPRARRSTTRKAARRLPERARPDRLEHAGTLHRAERAGVGERQGVAHRLRELDVRQLALLDHPRRAGLPLPVPQPSFYFIRNMFMVAMCIALVGYVVFPTAPPRFFPEWGFDDTVSDFIGDRPATASRVNALFNPFAAVPSMHVAFALMIGCPLARLVTHRAAARSPGRCTRSSSRSWSSPRATTSGWTPSSAPLTAARRRSRRQARSRRARPDRLGLRAGREGRGSDGRWPAPLRRRAPGRAGDVGGHARPPDRVAADAERDLAHRPRAQRRRRRARWQELVLPRRGRVHRRLDLRHARRALLAHVGQGHAVRRLPRLDAGPHGGGDRPDRRRRPTSPSAATTSRSPPSWSRCWSR